MELCKYPETGNVRTFHIEAIQMWGIFRVMKQTLGCRCKGIYRKIRERLM